MAGKKPNLTLVSDSSERASGGLAISAGFDFVSIGELSPKERDRLERLIEAACPKSGVLAVARPGKTWDLRPVVVRAGEPGPTIIRCAGPDVSLQPVLHERLRETFERLTHFRDLRSGVCDFGTLENQLWYRRVLVPSTLAHILSARSDLQIPSVVRLLAVLAQELQEWQSHGVWHGHLTTSNIALNADGSVLFLDAGIGAALAEASRECPPELVQTLAPEMLGNLALNARTDIYGLGQVFRRIFLVLRKKHQFTNDRHLVADLTDRHQALLDAMIAEVPTERPDIGEVVEALQVAKDGKSARASARSATPPPREAAASGRIVQKARPTVSMIMEPVTEDEGDAFLSELEREPVAEGFFDIDDIDDAALLEAPGQPTPAPLTTDRPPQRPFQQEPAGQRVAVATGTTTATGWVLLLGALVVVAVLFVRLFSPAYETVEYDLNQLRLDWMSKIPSRMLTVAEVALEKEYENKQVQDLIVASAHNGDELPGVDVGLLRVAFDSSWEMQLDHEDRRMAIAFALARLLGETAPQDLGPLDQRHPGVILAILSAAGEQTGRLLQRVPAHVLTKLPPPYGPAFQRLVESNMDLSCADGAVRNLARFSARGVEDVEDIAVYLAENGSVRLQALAIMFSHEAFAAKSALELLLNHPNIVLDLPEITWGRTWELQKWAELDESDQLFVLAGIAPSQKVQVENIAKLFLHPNPQLRAYAIADAINRVAFEHPASVAVLTSVRANPESVPPEQLARLAEILQQPSAVTEQRITELLDSEPPVELIAMILLSSAKKAEASTLDTWLAVYLNSKQWAPSSTELEALVAHPDRYTRLFAYNKALVSQDRQAAKALLEQSLTRETDPEFQEQLRLMIQQLQ
ncbi:MAG: hypothetical protein KDD69_01325 [Bdellovibrionales bacterium]|nr:hypothetical protein [Bdellovibrionales bacterium]